MYNVAGHSSRNTSGYLILVLYFTFSLDYFTILLEIHWKWRNIVYYYNYNIGSGIFGYHQGGVIVMEKLGVGIVKR